MSGTRTMTRAKYIDEYNNGNSFVMINPLTYISVKREIESTFSGWKVVEKNLETPQPRIGAFEITDITDYKIQVFNLLRSSLLHTPPGVDNTLQARLRSMVDNRSNYK